MMTVQAEVNDGDEITSQQHLPAQESGHSSACAQLRKHCQELGGRLTLTQVQLQAKSTALDDAEAALSAVKADQVGMRPTAACLFGRYLCCPVYIVHSYSSTYLYDLCKGSIQLVCFVLKSHGLIC